MGKLLRDETYIDAMNKQNALLQVLASDKISQMSSDWSQVAALVRGGYANQVYSIGDQFVDTWIDTANSNKAYENYAWDVVHFDTVELEGGETLPGMFIQSHYAHPFGVQFSHQRAFLRCPEGKVPGKYYFTIESAWGTNVTANMVVCFEITKAVPAKGRIAGCNGAPDVKKEQWRITTYGEDGKTVIEEGIVPTFERLDDATDLGIMHANRRDNDKGLNSCQEMAYGWNRWSTSALRQYLNSDATKGNWWKAQDDWDIAPTELATKDGFLCGMPEGLKKAIKPVKVVTYPNTVQDDTAGNTPDITYDKVFVPALEQIYVNPQKKGEGDVWEYWKRVAGTSTPLAQYGTYPQMRTYAVENTSSPQGVRLRSASRGYAYSAWYVGSSGYVYNGYGASYSYRFGAACVIC